MYNLPSRRRRKNNKRIVPNLIPVLDAVFIFIFFLLMSANFTKIFEIPSNVPMVSTEEPKKNEKPLALTVKIKNGFIEIFTGVPSRRIHQIANVSDKIPNLDQLHSVLFNIKKSNIKEKTAILEPIVDIEYDLIIKIMDSIRLINHTDESLYRKDKDGIDTKVEELFNNIIFGNIQS